jgi:hypothetical protein
MEIVQVGGNLEALGDIAVILILGAGYGVSLAETLGLLEGLMGPYAGIKVCGLLLEEVHCYIEELEACTASEEKDFVSFRDMEELLPEGPAFIHRGFPFLGTVGNGQYGHSRALEIFESFDRSVNDGLRKKAGTSIEYVYFCHNMR